MLQRSSLRWRRPPRWFPAWSRTLRRCRPCSGIAAHAGEFFRQDAGVTRAVKDVGATRVDLVEVELE
jgi:hypothetical protein